MKKRAFFVIGLEGSGTYMLFNALVEACDPNFYKILRRSIPHAHDIPDIKAIWRSLRNKDYIVKPIIIMRDMQSTLNSVNNRDESCELSAYHYWNRLQTLLIMLEGMGDVCEFITYEAFVGSEEYRRWLFEERLKIPYYLGDFEIYNANEKYYQEVE